MAKKLYPEEDIQAIGLAIQAKNGTSNTYTTSQMASAIRAIPSGGGIRSIERLTKKEYDGYPKAPSGTYPCKAYGCFSPFTAEEIAAFKAYCYANVTNVFSNGDKMAMYITAEDDTTYTVACVRFSSASRCGMYITESQYGYDTDLTPYNNNDDVWWHGTLEGAFLTVSKSTHAVTTHSSNYGSYEKQLNLPAKLSTGACNLYYFFYSEDETLKIALDSGPTNYTNFLTGYSYDYDGQDIENLENDVLYQIVDEECKQLVLQNFQGDTEIISKDTSDYEFYYEKIYPHNLSWHKTDIILGGDNYSRPWQLEMNLEAPEGTSESVIIGVYNEARELYKPSGSANNLCTYGPFFGTQGDVIVSDFPRKDIVIKHENGVITVTADGVQTYTASDVVNMSNVLRLFAYHNNLYPWSGLVNYIGFKWID